MHFLKRHFGIWLAALLLLGVPMLSPVLAQDAPQIGASALLQDVDGNQVGTVRFLEEADFGTLAIVVQVQNLTPGFHGFHLHTTGQCDPGTDPPFSSAGGHLNPADTNHPEHAGDLPPLLVMQDGTAAISVRTDRLTLADLLDDDGAAIIVHANADNFANIPERYAEAPDDDTLSSGDSGDRVACGVIEEGDIAPPEPAEAAATEEAAAESEDAESE